MIKNENIICISSIDWDFIWQGHQEIMSTLARNGNRVLFIENTGVRTPGIRDIPRVNSRIKNWLKGVKGIREEMPNLYIFSPLILPFPYLRLARWINRHLILSTLEKWVKITNFYEAIIWTFLPTPLTIDIIDNLSKKIVIYYCIDNFKESSDSAKKIKQYEIKLLKRVNWVFVTSQALYDYCSNYNKYVYTFPFAVDFEKFEKVRLEENDIPEELQGIKRPIVGYVGGIHRWVDQKLIKELAQNYPEYSFVFVGPIQTDVSLLLGLKNVHFLGKKEHKRVPYFIKYFDVCIIPYLVTEYIKNVYPTKLNEYHAMGKPVVSTEFPEVLNFNTKKENLIFIGRTSKEFIDCISRALNEKDTLLINKRIASAKENSWTNQIKEMSNLLEGAIEKRLYQSLNWQAAFLKFYKVARKKLFRLVTIVLSIYLLVFYTPLIWFLAAPLKISEKPKKVEAIVVFAGGVGESGKPGQGYEERVQQAVLLYRERYARSIIFSSGYMYRFKEPLVMKALAVSLGAPENAIILEGEAKNTYENVKFTKEILDKNSWDEIILVSSPYHMRRSSLVFDKIAKNIKVIYVPIKDSLFYAYPDRDIYGRKIWKRISFEQIRAIFHEYMGIIYYWFKGWI